MAAASLASGTLWLENPPQYSAKPIHGWEREDTISFGTYQTTTLESSVTAEPLAKLLTNLYQELSATQIDLDADMADILYANLWNLYE
jgi:hypothetical protein